jgi:hypothetical protein
MIKPVLLTAAVRGARTFAQGFLGTLALNNASIGISLSLPHALELAGAAGLAAVLHNLPAEKVTVPGVATVAFSGSSGSSGTSALTIVPAAVPAPAPVVVPVAPPPAPPNASA